MSTALGDLQRSSSLSRRVNGRLVSGVAAGLADSLGVARSYVRAAFVVLAFAGGVGLVAYVIIWILTAQRVGDDAADVEIGTSQKIGLALMLLAALIALRVMNLWFGDSVVWPIGLIAFGLAAIWDRGDHDDRIGSWLLPGVDASVRPSTSRLIAGTVVLFAGVGTFIASSDPLTSLGLPLLAAVITASGLVLLVGPWIVQLVTALNQERTDRVRSEERSEVAAHLHDSVLQTLALIQRTDDPKRMLTLARAQERELRQWLFEQDPTVDATMFTTALQAMAGRVERDYDVRVDIVSVGDVETTPQLDAVVRAAGEAAANAARHAGVDKVSVYAEIAGGRLDVFVSDQGKGFDLENIPEDRHGISESIIGRLQRHGGSATIESELGEGTEVSLSMPLETERS